MKMRLMLVLCAALASTVGVTAASTATTVTIGQTGDPRNNLRWNGGNEFVPAPGYVVPAGGGRIVSLNTESDSTCDFFGVFTQGIYNLQVLRPLGGGQYRVLGGTGHKTDPCDGQLHSYPVNIPVQAGDVLGVYVVSIWLGVWSGGGISAAVQQSEPAVGDTFVTNVFSLAAVDESATLLQVPTKTSDCKNDGWKSYGFKNQGDCVSFVATGGKNPPASG